MHFPTDYTSIQQRIAQVNPTRYAATRNYLDGAVSYLSPYISRGVISTNTVKEIVLKKYGFAASEKFVQELAWREYWQRVWQHLGNKILEDIKRPQPNVLHTKNLQNLLIHQTGITAIDESIAELYDTGYMHNHMRMYTSSLACNFGRAHWLAPSQWLYYHLLDGDVASNSLSWQWVAGSFSSKQYIFDQANLNKYSGMVQRNSFLQDAYENFEGMEVPQSLADTTEEKLVTKLPSHSKPVIDPALPLLIYNSYQLDPMWRKEEKANRVLLLEPSHFDKYPVSQKVLDFIIALAANIDGISIFTGEVGELTQGIAPSNICSKSHPAFTHYPGQRDSYEWMYPTASSYYPSFSAFWRACQKQR